jgi:hypothetical protein
VVLLCTLERRCHGSESTHGDGVDEEHETERQVELSIACSPGEELSALVRGNVSLLGEFLQARPSTG